MGESPPAAGLDKVKGSDSCDAGDLVRLTAVASKMLSNNDGADGECQGGNTATVDKTEDGDGGDVEMGGK